MRDQSKRLGVTHPHGWPRGQSTIRKRTGPWCARSARMAIDAVIFDVNGTLVDIATDEWGDRTLGVLKYHLRY